MAMHLECVMWFPLGLRCKAGGGDLRPLTANLPPLTPPSATIMKKSPVENLDAR